MAQKALAPDRKSDYWLVDSRKLVEQDGFNRREDYGDIPALAREIKAAGINNLDPLTCTKQGDNWLVLRGHRRCRALKLLEKEGEVIMVRIITPQRHFRKEDMILDQITGNQGKHFTPWEQAKVLRDLRALGWSLEDIVARSGKTKVYVKRLLSLADAPQKLINLVRAGKLSGTEAMDIIQEGKVDEVIARSEKGQPLGPVPAPVPAQDTLGAAPAPAAKERITKSDIRPNPWKVFKKWAPSVQEDKLPPVKKQALNLIIKIRDGEATEEDFNNFFS
jgi:ParB-like chromosome segregation protein Spo0J